MSTLAGGLPLRTKIVLLVERGQLFYALLILPMVVMAFGAGSFLEVSATGKTQSERALPGARSFQVRFQDVPVNVVGSSMKNSPEASDSDSGVTDPTSLQEYAAELLRRIDRAKRFPETEEMQNRRGSVVLRLEVSAQGRLQSLRVVAPSVFTAFDREALAAVRRASPFPPVPEDVGRGVVVNLKVRFVP